MNKILRGYFSEIKDDDAGGLSPGKEEDADMREIDRKRYWFSGWLTIIVAI